MQRIVVVSHHTPGDVQKVNDLLSKGWVVVRADVLNGLDAERQHHLPELYYVLEKI